MNHHFKVAGFDTGNGEKQSSFQTQSPSQAAWLLLSFSPFPVLNPAAPLCFYEVLFMVSNLSSYIMYIQAYWMADVYYID